MPDDDARGPLHWLAREHPIGKRVASQCGWTVLMVVLGLATVVLTWLDVVVPIGPLAAHATPWFGALVGTIVVMPSFIWLTLWRLWVFEERQGRRRELADKRRRALAVKISELEREVFDA